MNLPENQTVESRPYAQAPPQAKKDPWRATMGLNLRSECAKFVLGAFNLDVFSGAASGGLHQEAAELHFAERFARFLGSEPDAHFAMDHRRFISLRVPKAVTDVSLAEYASDGELLRLVPVFDAREPAGAESAVIAEAIRTVIAIFNRTRTMSEFQRPRVLARSVMQAPSPVVRRIAARILASTPVSFQPGTAAAEDRFTPPDFLRHRGFGIGFMAARCCWSPDRRGVDVWLQCHHAGGDGGPVQELLDRLAESWGVTAPPVLPPDNGNRIYAPAVWQFPGERRIGLLTDFVDLAPLAQLRRELASRLVPQVEAVPLAGLLIWCLSHQPEFRDVGINTAVDVPPEGAQPRAVDLVTIWPSRYHGRPDGFVAFLRDLLRLFADARVRKTPTWNSLVQLTSPPSLIGWAILRYLPQMTRGAFGSLTVSLVKGVTAIAAPMPDAAWDCGFIAVGKLGIQSESGPPVTPVSIKGDPDRIRSYPAALRRAIALSRSYVM